MGASPHSGTVATKTDPDGRWRGRVMVAGRVYTVSSRASRADCRRRLNRKIAEVLHPSFVPPPRRGAPAPAPPPPPAVVVADDPTLGAYLDEWVDGAALDRAPATVASYRKIVRLWIAPHVGAVRVGALRPPHLRALYAALAAGGLAPTSIRLVYVVLRAALNQCVREERAPLAASVLAARGPAARKREQPWATPDELTRIARAAASDRQYGPAIVLAVSSGMRIGEVLGLVDDDVDLASGEVTLSRQLGWCATRRALKSEAARRTVAVGPEATAALAARIADRNAQRAALGSDWVDREGLIFTTRRGAPVAQEVLRRAFRAACARAGVGGLHFHSLRHGHAMGLRRAGVDLDAIRARLGHADIGTTSGSYLHRDAVMDADASARFERLIADRRAARRANEEPP